MRIISGRHRGRRLVAPTGQTTRPTADRIREAVFNILDHGLDWKGFDGVAVLDVFAGSGAAGFEALSRGAGRATFLDSDRVALATIQRNAAVLGEAGRVTLLRVDAAHLSRPLAIVGVPAAIAFLDAPYGAGLTVMALAGLAAADWLEEGSVVVVEVGARELLTLPPTYTLLDARVWGRAQVNFLRYLPATP